MKKRMLKATLCFLICLSMIISASATLLASADGTHGFFMTCDSSVTDKKSDGFLIDFYSDSENALCTYWSNANWSMYTAATVKKFTYLNFKGGGAYAGLQLRGNTSDRTGIMSLWRYEYRDLTTNKTEYIYAKAIYGKTTTYDNEGSGTSCVMPYEWKNNQWYRELLYCWEDAETGYTFIGTWFYDYEADEWTLFAYYNTFLVDSYINGDIGQFLENYVESTRENYRSFRYRNIYFLSHETGEWVSSPKVHLRSDANEKAHGEAQLGVSEDNTYVWAWVDGRSDKDTDELLEIRPKLTQDAQPSVGKPVIDTFKVSEKKNGANISWKMAKNSTPQLSYEIVVTDSQGNEIAKQYETRPHIISFNLTGLETDSYKCDITVTDVFGQKATATYTSENYAAPSDSTSTSTPTTTPGSTDLPQTSIADDTATIATFNPVIYVVAAAVCVIVIAFVLVVVFRKKGKKNG